MNTMKQASQDNNLKKTGRPRAFDEAEALNKAMLVFWRHGYETTSMAVLTEEMSMSAPSVYSAFGDKKALFLRSLDLYVGDLDELKSFVDQSPTAYDATYKMLKASAIRFTGNQTPRGCMLASATASCSAESVDVQTVAAMKRSHIEEILRQRIERDIELKVLPKNTSSSGLAAMTIAVIQGLSVLARDGASRKKLFSVVELAMYAWNVSRK